jgi:hypothetical protein
MEQSPLHGASKSKVSKMEREYPPPPFPQRLVKPKNEVKSQVFPDEASTSKISEMEEVNALPFLQRLVKPKKETSCLIFLKY